MTDYNREMLKFIHDETEKVGVAIIKSGYVEDLNILIEKGFVEIDPEGTDTDGNFRVACTDAGEAEMKPKGFAPMSIAEMAAEADKETKLEVQPFKFEQPAIEFKMPVMLEPTGSATNFAVKLITGLKPPPEKLGKGAGRKSNPELFPFSTMEPGTAFYIAPTIEIQQPEKFYKVMVNQQNQRFKVKKFDETGNPVMYSRDSAKKGFRMIQKKELTREYAIYPAKIVPDSPYQEGAWVFRLK